MDCRLHPGTPAVGVCEGCGKPICELCRAKSFLQPLCYPCSWEREETEPASSPAEPQPGVIDELGVPLPEGPGVHGIAGDALRYLLAFFITGGVATVVGLAWWKFTALLGHDTWWYCIMAAVAVGFAARVAYGGRRGCFLTVIGAVMGAYVVLLHHALFVQDEVMETARGARLVKQLPLADRVVPLVILTFQSLTPYGWLLVGIGFVLGGVVPFYAGPPPAGPARRPVRAGTTSPPAPTESEDGSQNPQ